MRASRLKRRISCRSTFRIVTSFSNGACARIESAKIKQLALSSSAEIFPPVEDSEGSLNAIAAE